MAVVMSFLHHFDIPIKSIRIKHPYVQYHNRDITKEEVLTILNNSTIRNRAIYLILYETGMRPWTAVNLKWKHIKKDFLAKKVPMKIELTSDIMKCGVSDRFVFIGDYGFNALSNYLQQRRLPLKDDDFVFVTEKPYGQRIGTHAISQAFNVIIKRLKLAEPRGNKPKELRLYTLRKAFSKFMAVNVDRTLVEYWLGHTSTATHYVSEDLEFHRKMYAKGYPQLRLETPRVPIEVMEELKKITKLETKLQEKEIVIQSLIQNGQEKATELESLGVRFTEMEAALKAKTLEEKISEGQAEDAIARQNEIIDKLMVTVGKLAESQGLALEDLPYGDGDQTPKRWRKSQAKTKLGEKET